MAFIFGGVSKATFVRERCVPANDNDKFNDNKCAFCWDSYHNDHPAVRVLPCNHGPGGDLCIICRTPLFQLTLFKYLMTKMCHVRTWLMFGILDLTFRLQDFHDIHTFWLCWPVYFACLWLMRDFWPAWSWVLSELVGKWTNLRVHNPTFCLHSALHFTGAFAFMAYLCTNANFALGLPFLQGFTQYQLLKMDLLFLMNTVEHNNPANYDSIVGDCMTVALFRVTLWMIPATAVWIDMVRRHVRRWRDLALVFVVIQVYIIMINMEDMWLIIALLTNMSPQGTWVGRLIMVWSKRSQVIPEGLLY
ncbi:hypothetical protein P280DRAFT_482034 [Massarina eburnea CBS 473.64]|uniref:RING-type domain-containing protein n=1 Tax=Massarina eburnea CBS 473.64 TaxID=1395130 RepID=A0A6A6RWY9_9PLEO|nr:hypothetical protein P280DRAFT_482034 [Massarina eburnea CBS 473.64]